jgi:hypothetical protein
MKASFNIHSEKNQRIREEKQAEEGDKKFIKETYENKGKPIEIIKSKSKETLKLSKKPSQEIQKIKKEKDSVAIKENGDLAEMITISLGDGCIPKNEQSFKVTLNRSEEKDYTKYVKELMEKVFKQKPSIYNHKDADAVRMQYY